MRLLSSVVSTVLTALVLLAPMTTAQIVDYEIVPGERFSGEIDNTEDIDILEFETIAGSGFIIMCIAPGKPGLHPAIELRDITDGAETTVALDAAAKNRAFIWLKSSSLPGGTGVPSTGRYQVRISGQGTTGSYFVIVIEQLPREGTRLDIKEGGGRRRRLRGGV